MGTDDRNFFGFSLPELIKLSMYVIGLIIFLVKTDVRIAQLEKGYNVMLQTQARLTEFVENSDGWHSTVSGTQFRGGKPINDNYKFTEAGDIKRVQ